MMTGHICSNLAPFLSRSLSRRRIMAEMTVSEENSGGIFGSVGRGGLVSLTGMDMAYFLFSAMLKTVLEF